jgi:magnesium transporter
VTITCRLYRDGQVAEEDFDPERISDLLDEKDTLVWLDLEDPGQAEIQLLQEEFSLHPLAVEDAIHRNQRAKVEAYQNHSFLVIHGLRLHDGELHDSEIHVFVGAGFLVTLRYPPTFDLMPVRRRWEKQQPELLQEGGGTLLYTLLDEVVDDYFDVVERLEDESEQLEEAVFAETQPEDLQERIFRLRKQALQFRRRVTPLREVLDLLQDEVGVVSDRLRPYFRDVADHIIRVLEFIDNVRELLTAAREAYLSQVSNRLNEVMKQLTSWAAIILVPTLIAGIYGMNFIRPLPSFDNPTGFWIAMGLMVVSAGTLYWVFRRRNWI